MCERRNLRFLLLASIFFAMAVCSISAAEDIIYVKAGGAGGGTSWGDGYGELQDALETAGSGDEIWVAEGTYKPTSNYGLSNGDPDRLKHFRMVKGVAIYGGFAGIETSLAQRDVENNETILSGDIGTQGETSDNCYHVFYHQLGLNLNASAVLDGFTITGGNADGPYGSPDDFHNHGGGIFNYESSPRVTNCIFIGNSAEAGGGGMCNWVNSPMVVSSCRFIGNSAGQTGGGMVNAGYIITVTNCIFTGNSADGTDLINSGGGGMFNWGNTGVILTNCTLTGNSSKGYGGGISNYIEHHGGWEDSAVLTLTNCIMWGNTAYSGGNEIHLYGNTTISNCDISGCLTGGVWNDSLGTDGGGNIDADPLFIDPNGVDGIIGTVDDDVRLGAGSECIDTGDNSVVTWYTDLNGQPRIMDGDGDGTFTVDIGACEYLGDVHEPGVIYVDADAAGGDNGRSWADAFTSLHDALDAVIFGDEIWVADGTYRPDPNGHAFPPLSSFQLKNDVTMRGGYAGWGASDPNERDIELYETILSGNNYFFHVFFHPYFLGLDSSAVLDGFTITEGNAGGIGIDEYGGGMYNDSGNSPTVMNCTFRDNYANEFGGGMSNDNSSPVVTNCTFSENRNGGMYNSEGSSPIVTDCTFIGNLARYGGGMYNDSSSPTVTNCTFTGNRAPGFDYGYVYGGAGMYNYNSSPTLTGCTFSDNLHGGGMSNYSSSPIVINCTFSSNDYGGIYNHEESEPTVTNCTFSGNSGSRGGGMSNYGSSPTVTNSIFSGNWAVDGGGMSNEITMFGEMGEPIEPSNPIVINCVFIGNSADKFGGGMFNFSYGSLDGISGPTVISCTFSGNSADRQGGGMFNDLGCNPIVTDCTFNTNSADWGGGMFNWYGNPMISNCSFGGNSTVFGGGVCNLGDGDSILINCSFGGNSAVFGGGVCNLGDGDSILINCSFSGNLANRYGGGVYCRNSSTMVSNCILWGNVAADGGDEISLYDSTIDANSCDVQGGEAGIYHESSGNTVNWGGGNIDIDPEFIDPNGVDGVIGTEDDDVRLWSWSPCIDAGDNSVVTEPNDLDGHVRIADGDCDEVAVVDMGAYEFDWLYLGDFAGGCDVDLVDFAVLAASWQGDDPAIDIVPYYEGDGVIDLGELMVLAENWLVHHMINVSLGIDNSWMYQNLPGQTASNLTTAVSVTDDALGNSSYSYTWEFILPSDVTLEPVIMGPSYANCLTFASRRCDEPGGISGLGETFQVKVTVTGNEHGNTGSAQLHFGIALLGDVNNDRLVDLADRSIINAFWSDGSAGSFTLRDCDVNCDGLIDLADRSITNAIWCGTLGSNSITNPCPLR